MLNTAASEFLVKLCAILAANLEKIKPTDEIFAPSDNFHSWWAPPAPTSACTCVLIRCVAPESADTIII